MARLQHLPQWAAESSPVKLRQLKLQQVSVAGDGNCLFRDVAHELLGGTDRHLEIRDAVVAQVLLKKAYFWDFLELTMRTNYLLWKLLNEKWKL